MLVISEREVIDRLNFDNPWWEDKHTSIPYSSNPRRKYFSSFYYTVLDRSINRAVVLMGPRRVGKTVMVMQSIYELINHEGINNKNILFLSLETPIYTGSESSFEEEDEVLMMKWRAMKALQDKGS